jgi:acyl-CoA synthetase (AMP-forming)/AMP-acid ligase II
MVSFSGPTRPENAALLMHQLVLDAAERRPDKVALRWIDRDRALTYAEAVARMDDCAGFLAELGVRRGDRVSIVAHNGLDYLVALFGCWRLGAIAALVNVRFAGELDYYLGDHTPTVVIYTHDIHDAVRAAAAKLPSLRALVCMDGPMDGALAMPQLMAAKLTPPADPRDAGAIAHLSYTSGTTGQPKGACLAHEPTVTACRCIGERLRLTGADVSFGPTALSSSYQLVANLLPPLAVAAEINVMGRWTREAGFDALDRFGATAFVANPILLEDVRAESVARGRVPGRLRFGLSGGGPVPPSLKIAWRDELNLPLVESYGQSELGGFMALGRPELEPDDAKLMRVGPPLPDKEVRILGRDDAPVGVGEIGEVALTGGFMAGYWNRPDKTAETTRGGWLHSGDVGILDADGYVTMRGRKSELLHVAGVTWFPRDVEEAIARAGNVRQAAVVGIPDTALGQRPVAFVESETALDAAALKTAAQALVAYDLAPMRVAVLNALPMTVTGKIAKAELAARAAKEALA